MADSQLRMEDDGRHVALRGSQELQQLVSQHHELDDRAGVEDQVEDRKVLRDVHCKASSWLRSAAGIDLIFMRSISTHTI